MSQLIIGITGLSCSGKTTFIYCASIGTSLTWHDSLVLDSSKSLVMTEQAPKILFTSKVHVVNSDPKINKSQMLLVLIPNS